MRSAVPQPHLPAQPQATIPRPEPHPGRPFVIYRLFEGHAIATRREGGTALNFSQQKSFFIRPDKLCSISTEYHKNAPKREAKIGHFQSTISRFDFHSELSAINIIPARHSGPLSFASQVYNLFLCYGFMGCNKRDAPLIRRGGSVRLYVHVLRRYGSRKQRVIEVRHARLLKREKQENHRDAEFVEAYLDLDTCQARRFYQPLLMSFNGQKVVLQ
ncbi:MAG: hypothetical protein ACLTZY_04050 [Alistipes indistinctus]